MAAIEAAPTEAGVMHKHEANTKAKPRQRTGRVIHFPQQRRRPQLFSEEDQDWFNFLAVEDEHEAQHDWIDTQHPRATDPGPCSLLPNRLDPGCRLGRAKRQSLWAWT